MTSGPAVPPIYKQYRLESWLDFLKIIIDSPYSNWAFRGHRKAILAAGVARCRAIFRNFHIDPRAWPQQEGRILRVFKRKAHHFLAQLPAPDNDFQWLALMQHNGAPTRLLDFTWSPYVAAFFALERATPAIAAVSMGAQPGGHRASVRRHPPRRRLFGGNLTRRHHLRSKWDPRIGGAISRAIF